MWQFRYKQSLYRFQFKRGFFIFSLIIIALCSALGVWQVHRYHVKQVLVASIARHQTEAPQPLARVVNAQKDLAYQPVRVSGYYLNEMTMVVQNRMHGDRLGFEVLTPMRIPGEKTLLLVNRGWVPAPLTSLPAVTGLQEIQGVLKFYNEYQFILGKNILTTASPVMMQKVDVAEISRVTHQVFYPFVLRLDASAMSGFVREWGGVSVLPQRHMAYAVQWFAMAFVMLVAFFCFCCEREN